MSTQQQPLIIPATYESTCRLCGQKFAGKPLDPPTNGEPNARMQKLGKVLYDHLVNAHRDFAFMALLAAGYITEDPVATGFIAPFRYGVFQQTRRAFVPDDVMKDRLTRMTTPEQIEAGFFELRDFLCEQGKFAPAPVQAAMEEAKRQAQLQQQQSQNGGQQ